MVFLTGSKALSKVVTVMVVLYHFAVESDVLLSERVPSVAISSGSDGTRAYGHISFLYKLEPHYRSYHLKSLFHCFAVDC